MADAARRLSELVTKRMGHRPFVVAIDGCAGAGKSTLAAAVAELLGDCRVIDGDDFYAGGTQREWDARTVPEKVDRVMDWRAQRDALSALRERRRARWHGYDWEAFDGRRVTTPTVAEPAGVIVLEGAYSCRPELTDLLDLRILVEAGPATRHERLRARDGDAWHDAWFDRWDEAERYYFGQVVPRSGFDLVLMT